MDEVEIYAIIGQKIKVLRQSRGMSQQALADECGMEYPNLSRIENGRTNPTIRSIWKICKALNVQVKEIFDFDTI